MNTDDDSQTARDGISGHQFDKLFEQIGGVVGSGGRLGMILNGEDRKIPVAHPFQSSIVQVDVCQFDFVPVQGVRIKRETVVLGGDLDFSGVEFPNRLICSPVSELEFVGPASQGKAEELVSQADAEDGFFAA